MKRETKNLRLVIHKASEDRNKAISHQEGHNLVLQNYGITAVSIPQILDSTYYVNFEDVHSNTIVAGCRLVSSINKLPIQSALNIEQSDLFQSSNKDCYELCGLWVSQNYIGYNLGQLILRSAIAFSHSIGITELILLSSSSTLKLMQNLGFVIVNNIGQEGTVLYPKEDIKAHVLRLNLKKAKLDVETLRLSNPTSRTISFEQNNVQINLDVDLVKPKISSIQKSLSVVDKEFYDRLITNPELLNEIHWRKFEYLIGDMLEASGYEIDIMQGTKDGGIDVVAFSKSSEFGKHKYILQAKRWKNKVQVDPIRNLLFVKDHEGATKSCLATTSYFTRGAIELGEQYKWDLELKDRDSIIQWINRTKNIKYGE